MPKAIMALGLAVMMLAQSPVALAQESSAPQDWTAVKSVPAGDELIIRLKNRKTVRGKLKDASDTELILLNKKKEITVMRQDVFQVHRVLGKAAKGKYSLIGAGAGAAAGAGIGSIKGSTVGDDGGVFVGLGMAIGAGVGALAGLGIGISKRKRVLIYQGK